LSEKQFQNGNLPLVATDAIDPLCLLRPLTADTRWQRQRHNTPQHAPKEPPWEMRLRQQQPVIAGVVLAGRLYKAIVTYIVGIKEPNDFLL
jgi:hypothetical protein